MDVEKGGKGTDKFLSEKENKFSKIHSSSQSSKYAFCFIGLLVSYILWGITQENLMTREYKHGKFDSAAFCVFGNRLLALIVSLLIVGWKKYFSQKPLKEAPFYYYAPSSLSNTLSSWAQYQSLKYITFPTQVLSKSCKVIPVMLVGILLNRKTYPSYEYIEALLITVGVASFNLSLPHSSNRGQDNDSTYGILLLCLYLVCDSFTSQWQSKVYKKYNIDQYQMMLGVNIWSMIMTGVTLYQSGEFLSSFAFLVADSNAFMDMAVLSITSATGQLFIFYTIKELGPVAFTIIMTLRQILSLIISCILYKHSMTIWSTISAITVFCIVINRVQRK